MPDELVTAGSFEQMRQHITEQLARIAADNDTRTRLLTADSGRGW